MVAVTINALHELKKHDKKFPVITAYDASFSRLAHNAGIDVILVGDSASNVMAGHETTLPITLDQMIYHASSVVRAIDRALVVVDLPFGTYQSDSKEALRSAIRIMKESGGHAVKLEGGKEIKDSIKKILNAGIPVMGHLGLTPQSIYKFGTYTVRAKEDEEAQQLIEDAKLLERLGCFALVLEKIPAALAQQVAESISIPVIGIGAGGGAMTNLSGWQKVMSVNLFGIVHGVQAFSPMLIEQGRPAVIINTGSKQGLTNPPGNAAYNASKAGVRFLTESLAHELRNTQGCEVSAHLLVPGFTYTGLISKRVPEKPDAAWSPAQVVEFMLEALAAGDFYIICPDNDVTVALDRRRIEWNTRDVVENRPALSRWHPDYAEEFADFVQS